MMQLAKWRPWRRTELNSSPRKPGDLKSMALAAELEMWRDRRVFVNVSVPHDDRAYQSMVLAVSPSKGLFLIDALFPFESSSQYLLHQVLGLEARGLKLRTYLSARCINFGTELQDASAVERKGQTLVMQIPNSAAKSPRRAAFRVSLTHTRDAQAQWLGTHGQPEATGKNTLESFPIENISSTGLAVRVPVGFAQAVKESGAGSVLVSVFDTMFEADVMVRHLRLLSHSEAVLGLEFCRLSADKVLKLEQWVTRLQRQVLLHLNGQ